MVSVFLRCSLSSAGSSSVYDVFLLEEACEMVALSLMRRNEDKIMACMEFEDAMQLLLHIEEPLGHVGHC
jgi:hypothetical protein